MSLKKLALGAAAAALACGAALAGETSTRIIEIIGERQTSPQAPAGTPAVAVYKKKPCGSKADEFYCGRVFRAMKESSLAYRGTPLSVTADTSSDVLVSWSGLVYCEMKNEPAGKGTDPSKIEFVVDLAIQDGTSNTIVVGEEGSTRIGSRERPSRDDVDDGDYSVFRYYPISLTRAYVKRKTSSESYHLNLTADIRTGYGFCDVRGGSMTAVVVNG
ncbi:hypothetical protein [Hansschlegelia zhihuaiae]|uniref:Uncharacterized protein n=1 Tax=Hansschlegelia zhihuaiae TaxID=405005 RepID=A0A4Q0MQ06_9HYPH|nr:hypothetical protein [Hansschlegelia zhihuaiae]RXF75176.1 hypothetical protein EK403_03795 [Hansschlegelia zhihuaiae]